MMRPWARPLPNRTFLALLCLFVLFSSCQARLEDPFLDAEQAAEQGDLLYTLWRLDEVPPAHPRYGEARAFAQALERRLQTSHELILRGMSMRSEWRDEEAIRFFQQALEVWPGVASAEELIRATQNRVLALESDSTQGVVQEAITTTTEPSDSSPAEPIAEIVLGPSLEETPKPAGPREPREPGEPTEPREPQEKPTPSEQKRPEVEEDEDEEEMRKGCRPKLLAAERHLERGEMEAAMDLLQSLRVDFPENKESARMLARVLHQRALLRYGQGFLEGAIEDWQEVTLIQPDNKQAHAFLKAARTEKELRQGR